MKPAKRNRPAGTAQSGSAKLAHAEGAARFASHARRSMRELQQQANEVADSTESLLRQDHLRYKKKLCEAIAGLDKVIEQYPTEARELELEKEKELAIQAVRELELDITRVPEELRETAQRSVNKVDAALDRVTRSEAEGFRFRQLFLTMNLTEIAGYLAKRRIDPWWLAGFSGDPEARRKLQEAQKKGAKANRTAKDVRETEARKIYADPNPETGRPWERKEHCIAYLMRKKGWSRSAINSYLPKKKGGA